MKTLLSSLAIAAMLIVGGAAVRADDGHGHPGYGPSHNYGYSQHGGYSRTTPGYSFYGKYYGNPYQHYRSPGYYSAPRTSYYYGYPRSTPTYRPSMGFGPNSYYTSPRYYGGYSAWGYPYSSYGSPYRGSTSFSFSLGW